MANETRTAIATLTESMLALKQEMNAGFARMDRYFELQQAQHVDLTQRVDSLTQRVDSLTERMDSLTQDVKALTERVERLERGFVSLRDFVAREIADIRVELRVLRHRSDQTAEMRREIDELTARVDRIERRQQD